MSLLNLSPVQSHRHFPDSETSNPKDFKKNVLEYIKGGIPLNRSPSEEFIPYAQERDFLGNLITRRSTRASPSPSPALTASKSHMLRTKASSLFSLDGVSPGGSELSFNAFKFQSKVGTQTSLPQKIAIKQILKPLDPNKLSRKASSPCFRAGGREVKLQGQPKFQDFPAVGHYDFSDRLVHKTPQKISFNREERLKKPRIIQRSGSQEDIDVIAAYNRVYYRKPSVPEFSKHTDRASHYYTNLESGLAIVKEPKQVLNLEKYEEELPKKNPLDFILKDNVVEVPPRWKRGFEVDPKNMPIELPKMTVKFVEMKKKYQVWKPKLS